MAYRTTEQVFDVSKVYVLYDKDGNRVVSFTDDPDKVRGLYNSNPTLVETSSVDTGANTNVTLQRVFAIPDDHERQRFSENQGTVDGGIVRSKLMGILAPYAEPFRLPEFSERVSSVGGSESLSYIFRNVPENFVIESISGPGSPSVVTDRTVVYASFTQTMTSQNQNRLYGVSGSPQIPTSGDVDFYVEGALVRTRTVAQLMSVRSSNFGDRVVGNAYGFFHGGRIYWIGRSGRTILLGCTGSVGSRTDFVARKDSVRASVTLPYTVVEGDDIQFNASYPSVASGVRRIEIVMGGQTIYWILARSPFSQRRITQEVGKESSEGYLVYLPAGKTQANINDYEFFADHDTDIFAEERPGVIGYSFLRTGEVGVTVDAYAKDVTQDGKRTVVTCNGTPHISSEREVSRDDTRLAGITLYRGAEYCVQDLRSYFNINGGALSVSGATDVVASVTKTSTEFSLRLVPRDTAVTTIASNAITLTQGDNIKVLNVEVYPRERVGTDNKYSVTKVLGRDLALNAGLTYFYELDRFDWTVYADDDEDHEISDLTFSLGSGDSRVALADGTSLVIADYTLSILSGDTYPTLQIKGVNAGDVTCVLKVVDDVLSESSIADVNKSIKVRDIRGYTEQRGRDDVYFVSPSPYVDTPVADDKLVQENALPALPAVNGMPVRLVYMQDGIDLEVTLDANDRVRVTERDPSVGLRLEESEYDLNGSPLFKHVNFFSDQESTFRWPLLDSGDA